MLPPVDNLESRRLGLELDDGNADRRRFHVDGRDAHSYRPVATCRCRAPRGGVAVADGAVDGEGLEGGAVAQAGVGDERTDVGAEGAVEDLGGDHGVVALLGFGELRAIDAQRLRERDLHGVASLA